MNGRFNSLFQSIFQIFLDMCCTDINLLYVAELLQEKNQALLCDDYLTVIEIQKKIKIMQIPEIDSIDTTFAQNSKGQWGFITGRHNVAAFVNLSL